MALPFLGGDNNQQQPDQKDFPNIGQVNIGQDDGTATNAKFNYYYLIQTFQEEKQAIAQMLRGMTTEFDAKTNKVVYNYPLDVTTGKRMEPERVQACNIEGQMFIMNWLDAQLSPGTPLSSLSETSLYTTLDFDGLALLDAMYLNAQNWKIDPTKYEAIYMGIMSRVEMARRRAVGDAERGFVGRAITVLSTMGSKSQGSAPSMGNMFQGSRKF